MFERNRVDAKPVESKSGVPVEITLDDGQQLKGRFLVPNSRTVFDFLNGPSAFLEFETYQGEATLMAKTTIRDIKLVGVPKSVGLDGGHGPSPAARDGFDPYRVLGISRSADYDTIRDAFHTLSKTYHPDRYSTVELPEEVQAYLATMSRRVNAAYAALSEPMQVKRHVAKHKSEPIYQSGPRG